jgi:hypothetical protein
MLMCNPVMLKAGVFTAGPAAVAVVPNRFVAAFIIKNLHTALVWRAWGQSERK